MCPASMTLRAGRSGDHRVRTTVADPVDVDLGPRTAPASSRQTRAARCLRRSEGPCASRRRWRKAIVHRLGGFGSFPSRRHDHSSNRRSGRISWRGSSRSVGLRDAPASPRSVVAPSERPESTECHRPALGFGPAAMLRATAFARGPTRLIQTARVERDQETRSPTRSVSTPGREEERATDQDGDRRRRP